MAQRKSEDDRCCHLDRSWSRQELLILRRGRRTIPQVIERCMQRESARVPCASTKGSRNSLAKPNDTVSEGIMNFENILLEKKNAIAYVTVNRPKVLNALTWQPWKSYGRRFMRSRMMRRFVWSFLLARARRHLSRESSFDAAGVERQRRTEYLRLNEKAGRLAPETLLAFHRSHMSLASAYSPCMHRSDAQTVSFSRIVVRNSVGRFFYTDGAPCAEKSSGEKVSDRSWGLRNVGSFFKRSDGYNGYI